MLCAQAANATTVDKTGTGEIGATATSQAKVQIVTIGAAETSQNTVQMEATGSIEISQSKVQIDIKTQESEMMHPKLEKPELEATQREA
jgi:hypothetical protein